MVNRFASPRIMSFRQSGPGAKWLALGAGAVLVGTAAAWARRKLRSELSVAPGWPGRTPHWTSSAKQGVGSSLGTQSNLWFTLFDGVVTEVFWPRVDQPAVAQTEFIVTASDGHYSEEMRDTEHAIEYAHDGVPLFHLKNSCREGRYRIEKTIFSDPSGPVLLQRARFVPLQGRLDDYRLYVAIKPHLGNHGWRNEGWVDCYQGWNILFAKETGHAMAFAASTPWKKMSAGFTGVSDGRRQLRRYGYLRQTYRRAPFGDVTLIGEIDLAACGGEFVLALGFGAAPDEAALHVRRTLLADMAAIEDQYVRQWLDWQAGLGTQNVVPSPGRDLYRASAMVMAAHEDKRVRGAFVASLSIPWGEARKTDDLYGPVGYHVVWPRDLYMTASGLLAAGDGSAARRALDYCQATQQGNGGWPQNQAVNGRTVWTGKQLGETSMPVLLLDLLNRAQLLTCEDRRRFWPMVRDAVAQIVRCGPSAQEDRWENAAGFTPFTLSNMIAALVVAAELADEQDEKQVGTFLREVADAWHGDIDRWTYVNNTPLARRVGVPGYYLRVAPPDRYGEPVKYLGPSEFWYRPSRDQDHPPSEIVSVDALAYVRFGLRAPDDPRILDTIKVIDAVLKTETPFGPCWHRYSHDGYGEQKDGTPFDGRRGTGRLWPLLTGERAHYELLAGRPDEARRLLAAMERFAGDGNMLPEQIWDSCDLPKKGLYLGRPSGSAMPLAWAHAEYIKLRHSLAEGRVFDQPPQTRQRYVVDRVESPYKIWRENHRRRSIPAGKSLRIILNHPAMVNFACGEDTGRIETRDSGLEVHYVDLPTAHLPPGSTIRFRLNRPDANWAQTGAWFATVSDVVHVEAVEEFALSERKETLGAGQARPF
ncbi:MAG TPA: glycoside hydrolase family 15 protein [Pirellulales bacterium]|nr:glycoside hydrolase family 15 protein [Pirellulales bacterium]